MNSQAPDFKGYKKITDEEAELLVPLGVVYFDFHVSGSFEWAEDAPYDLCNTPHELNSVKRMDTRQFYLKIEDN